MVGWPIATMGRFRKYKTKAKETKEKTIAKPTRAYPKPCTIRVVLLLSMVLTLRLLVKDLLSMRGRTNL